MSSKLKKAYELFKKYYGLFGVFYPVIAAYLKGHGVFLPELGDLTLAAQVTGGVALAQANPVINKK